MLPPPFERVGVAEVALAAAGLYLLKRVLSKKNPAPLPPGPRPLPLIGNALDMPSAEEWKTFTKWAGEYGDIVSLNVLGQPIIILNSNKVAIDMLDKKSTIYSDRPVFKMGGEICGWEKALGMSAYGERFREYRKLFHRVIGTKERMDRLMPLEELETRRFLKRVLESPSEFRTHIRNCAGTIILRVAYGYEVSSDDDPIVKAVNEAMEVFGASTAPGAFFVDIIPQLQYVPEWFPGTGWKQTAKVWKKSVQDMTELPFQFVKEQIAVGVPQNNFTGELLEQEKPDAAREDIIKWAATSMYAGGADTTVSAVSSFFLLMATHPSVQRKAQAEIDAVVGTERLPTFEDRESLPYVQALVKEVFRWHPVAPIGVPHRSLGDDIHDGYFIPKGSIIFANIYLHLHDPATYANPDVFDPARFMGPTPEKDPRSIIFGYGRRICPGLQLADAAVWISCVLALAALDIAPTDDAPIVAAYTSGVVSHPKEFACAIKPRSARAEALVSSAV